MTWGKKLSGDQLAKTKRLSSFFRMLFWNILLKIWQKISNWQ